MDDNCSQELQPPASLGNHEIDGRAVPRTNCSDSAAVPLLIQSSSYLPTNAPASMESLPTEILEMILMWDVRLCRTEKNVILPLRLVCSAFDQVLRPYIFKTLQLEFSRFARDKIPPSSEAIKRVGDLCTAVHIDMMVIRDEEEISRLSQIFRGILGKVPEMTTLLDSLRKYCMNENTFEAADFRRVTNVVLHSTPHMTRLKLNLPFQVVGVASKTATLLLANTLASVAQRPAEFSKIETLVLDHVSDTTINSLCSNPMDITNAQATFHRLKHLVLSIKRQESRQAAMNMFTMHLWFLIRQATKLETLCIIGWNVKRNGQTRTNHSNVSSFTEWSMRTIPFILDPLLPARRLEYLRCIELKRVDIEPWALNGLVESVCSSLKELYLNEVYLKVFGSSELERTPLWIGHGPVVRKPDGSLWLAESLRNMEGLQLEVLRATGLGYDDFDPDKTSAYPNYDLSDPKALGRSFDQRFVEAVFGIGIEIEMMDAPSQSDEALELDVIPSSDVTPVSFEASSSVPPPTLAEPSVSPPTHTASPSRNDSSISLLRARRTGSHRIHKIRPKIDYDAETYQRHRNVTSHFKRCIDGWFTNHNEQALRELQKIITVADRGMTLLNEEIERSHAEAMNAMDRAT
ncbi:hypothetical protein PVAG01_01357 [Phlyctema vagabunda]|uniref:F-box domain-containing protein n=1 Tax=Phlyctema vagabunda TaxID=108571 RepID=A0ABR4PWX2_9HELO